MLESGSESFTLPSFTIILSHLYKRLLSVIFSLTSSGYAMYASVLLLPKLRELGVLFSVVAEEVGVSVSSERKKLHIKRSKRIHHIIGTK